MLDLLQLIQLSDSALPIGASAHSFGLETLTAEGELRADNLAPFFADYLAETGPLDALYCRRAYGLAVAHPNGGTEAMSANFCTEWIALNQTFSARRVARESREASSTLGKRFLRLVASLAPEPRIQEALHGWGDVEKVIHHCTAFGLVGGCFAVDADVVVGAYLQQSLTGLLSACQRLMPVGQMQALTLAWQLKPQIAQIVEESRVVSNDSEVYTFAPLLDLAGMRHANLPVRLFIS